MNYPPARIHALLGAALLTLAGWTATAQQGYPPPPGPYPVGPATMPATPTGRSRGDGSTTPQAQPGSGYDATTLFGAPRNEAPGQTALPNAPTFVGRETPRPDPAATAPADPVTSPPTGRSDSGPAPAPDRLFRPANPLPY